MRRAFVICSILAACPAVSLVAGGSQLPTSSDRTMIVIGDLHLGVGRDRTGWHAYEDFRWRDEFIAFLEAVNAEGAGATDLVINGDLFDLVQSPTIACAHDEPRLGCTEQEALARLEIVVAAHRDELQAIGRFAAAGANRVHVVAGDHDAALVFPSVARRALQAFDAPADRIAISASNGWLSADGRVYVEHGHQLALSADRFATWPRAVVSAGGREYIERPWGEQLVQPLYDRVELRTPIVDNVVQEGTGAKYVLASEDISERVDVRAWLRFFLTKTTWQQFRMDLDDGEVQAPSWDLAQTRRDPAAFAVSSVPADDPLATIVAKAAAEGRLTAFAADMSDAEIIAICDYRAAIRRARRRMERVLTQLPGVGPPVAECPRLPETVGSAFEYYWRSRDVMMSQHIDATLDALKREGRASRPFEVFVSGHTHLADRPFRPAGDTGHVVATSGVWQRTITPVRLEQIAKERGISIVELLPTLQPEALAPCYSFLRIASSSKPSVPEPRAWLRTQQGVWTMASSCGG